MILESLRFEDESEHEYEIYLKVFVRQNEKNQNEAFWGVFFH